MMLSEVHFKGEGRLHNGFPLVNREIFSEFNVLCVSFTRSVLNKRQPGQNLVVVV